ncbi:GntR family transcriptional regulator [Georgenia sp. EYE_87]|uniref:GntR family transcriptional regulator n=1 Tax=Georgenia sp. EYE_87 TaxID=2853448 RepID=UPI0020041BE3|nr:GntR family transcriptional regulator [Georgenia sp. EYE_87]MCK6210557.1 GntR family transcriptional regulator [Georgenia sp. EYE_87]
MKKYDAIVKDLLALIDTKRPGDRIPSEQELAASYNVSAMTVRRAMQVLNASGRTVGIPGKGTFVRAPTVLKALSSTSFSETIRASGKRPSSRLLLASMEPANEEEREILELAPNSLVIHVHRVRYGDDVPLCVERATLVADLFPGLLGRDLTDSLYATLRSKYGTLISRTRFEVTATFADRETSALLEIGSPTPCLETRTVSRNQDGALVEFTTSLYRGDMYRLVLETGS